MNNYNYVIRTPDRRKSSQLVHVNLLKEYHQPVVVANPIALHCASDSNITRDSKMSRLTRVCTDDEVSSMIPATLDTNNSDILNQMPDYFQHLSPDRRTQLHDLLNEHRSVCADVPGECKTAEHDIQLVPDVGPIRQQFYRINQEKLKLMKEEVVYLLHTKGIPLHLGAKTWWEGKTVYRLS